MMNFTEMLSAAVGLSQLPPRVANFLIGLVCVVIIAGAIAILVVATR